MNASTSETRSKLLANQLAQAVAAPGGNELIYLLQQVGLINGAGEDMPSAEENRTPQPASGRRVGIWERSGDSGSGAFVRCADRESEWHLWANVTRIEPKRAKRRAVFLGESVARGWGHPPPYAPARVLQTLLENVLGPGEIEVVDLARSDMAFEVREHAIAAEALDPDLLVLFAGNNWRPKLDRDPQEIEATVSREGAPGLKALSEKRLAEAAGKVVNDICAFYAERNVPVVWIVPEWNLLDWHDWKVNAPVLGGTANREWVTCSQRAEKALAERDYAAAARFAEKMIGLDEGTASFGQRILAECRRNQGRLDEARRLLELSRDARIWSSSYLTAPRPYAVTQNAIRQGAAKWNCKVVDLPEIFAEHTNGGIPDRKLFLDYCHLTFEGIRIAMSCAAAAVGELLTGNRIDARTLLREAPEAKGRVLADAALMAAIHNAHWWQTEEVVRHFCSEAVTFDPQMADMMTALIDLQTSPAPVQLSEAASNIAMLQQQGTNAYVLRNTVQLLDPFLLEGIAGVLDDGQKAAQSKLLAQWRERNDLAREPADLLSHYYLSASTQPQELAWAMPAEVDDRRFASTDYYRAYWVESNFPFVASNGSDLSLTLTLRLPNSEHVSETVDITVNGRHVAAVSAKQTWSTARVKVPREALRDGVNTVVVQWPLPPEISMDRTEQAARNLARGESDALFDVFGEIHRLTVAAAAA